MQVYTDTRVCFDLNTDEEEHEMFKKYTYTKEWVEKRLATNIISYSKAEVFGCWSGEDDKASQDDDLIHANELIDAVRTAWDTIEAQVKDKTALDLVAPLFDGFIKSIELKREKARENAWENRHDH